MLLYDWQAFHSAMLTRITSVEKQQKIRSQLQI